MRFNPCWILLWAMGPALLCSTSLADCGAEPEGFEPWPDDEAIPVVAIPSGEWFRSSTGWIIAPDRCQAAAVAWEGQAAFEAFALHFDRTPTPGSVVDVKHAGAFAQLRAAGAAWVLPWRFTPETGNGVSPDPRAEAIRKQIESQLAGNGRTADPRQVEALVQRALSQLSPTTKSEPGVLEPKALRHEIAHMLFLHGVWPSTRTAGMQYGGDAPDWLDEAAAVAAESIEMTAARRAVFNDAAREGRLIPLERYLSMTHPVFGGNDMQKLMREARETAAREGAAVLSASVGDEQIAEARLFYAQTRGWLDFLQESTDNPRILGAVAEVLLGGRSFEEWLIQVGPDLGLPGSMDALESMFESWAAARA